MADASGFVHRLAVYHQHSQNLEMTTTKTQFNSNELECLDNDHNYVVISNTIHRLIQYNKQNKL